MFLSNACDRRPVVQEIDVVNLGGGSTDFRLSTTVLGVRISPESGSTPARVRIEVDPTFFSNSDRHHIHTFGDRFLGRRQYSSARTIVD